MVLYELLTGEIPFRGDKQMLIFQILRDEPPSPRRIDSRVPRDLETICLKCRQKEPGQRYQTAEQLGEDLRRFLGGEAVLARPISQAARLWRWCRRNRLIATLTATVAASLLVGIAVSGYFAIEANDERNSALRLAAEKDKLAQEKTKLAADEIAARRLAEQRLTRSEWLLYASQIARAQQAWDDGNIAAAWESLDDCREDFRGWEYDYLFTRFNRNQLTLRGHSSAVSSVTFSPDGRRIVSSSDDNTLKVWDAESGQETLTLT